MSFRPCSAIWPDWRHEITTPYAARAYQPQVLTNDQTVGLDSVSIDLKPSDGRDWIWRYLTLHPCLSSGMSELGGE